MRQSCDFSACCTWVVLPRPHLRGLQAERESLLAGPQLLLRALAVRDIARRPGNHLYLAVGAEHRREDVLVDSKDAGARRFERDLALDWALGLDDMRDLAHVHVVVPLFVPELAPRLTDYVRKLHPPSLEQAPVRIYEPALEVEQIHEVRRRRCDAVEDTHLSLIPVDGLSKSDVGSLEISDFHRRYAEAARACRERYGEVRGPPVRNLAQPAWNGAVYLAVRLNLSRLEDALQQWAEFLDKLRGRSLRDFPTIVSRVRPKYLGVSESVLHVPELFIEDVEDSRRLREECFERGLGDSARVLSIAQTFQRASWYLPSPFQLD